MKYFTKYLPVEGKVKEGDKFFLGNSTLPLTKNSFLEKELPLSTDNDPKTLVKLFLCSRDIQVGDIITFQHLGGCGNFEVGEVDDVDKDIVWPIDNPDINISNCYKVIGELSPDAIWVKEGDKFDEYELWYYSPITKQFIMKKLIDENLEWKKAVEIRIKLKCSQCNTFH